MKKLLVILLVLFSFVGCSNNTKQLSMEEINKMEVLDTNSFTIQSAESEVIVEVVDEKHFFMSFNANGNLFFALAGIENEWYLGLNSEGTTSWLKTEMPDEVSSGDITDTYTGSFQEYLSASNLEIKEAKNGITYVTGQIKNEDYDPEYIAYIYTVKFTFDGQEVTVKYPADFFSQPEIISGELPEDFFDNWYADFDEMVVQYLGEDSAIYGTTIPTTLVSKEEVKENEFYEVTFEYNQDAKIVGLSYEESGVAVHVTFNKKVTQSSFTVPTDAEETDYETFVYALFAAMFSQAFALVNYL